MKTNIMTYLSILLSLLILDGMWLGWVAKDSYQLAMGHIMRDKVIIWPWIVFYLLYPLAILILAVNVQSLAQSRFQFLCRGAVLGLTAYGTYNLTNYALVVDWPLFITIKDWLWGAVLTSISAWVGGNVWLGKSISRNQG